MNLIYLHPTDVLFFRDGRPMSGSLAGHTAAWPLPDVTDHALHAALHRADLEKQGGERLHPHRRGRSGHYSNDKAHCDRKFGSLATAGPFPVREKDGSRTWFFPRPRDAQTNGTVEVTLRPVDSFPGVEKPWRTGSLHKSLAYAVANTLPPSKDTGGEPWMSAAAFEAYLRDGDSKPTSPGLHFLRDDQIADVEAQIGIGIKAETGTVAESEFYSAYYLRLREEFRLGLLAEAKDKEFKQHDGDLIKALLDGNPAQIIVGGQRRLCRAQREDVPAKGLPLPCGLDAGFHQLPNGRFAIKWVLLSPALWPEIPEGTSKRGTTRNFHPGGWLPNWICPDTGLVLLRTVDEAERHRRRSLNYSGKGYATDDGNAGQVAASLVAAIVPKPIVVTGWSLPNGADCAQAGARSTHLAVPPGAIYYLEAEPDANGGQRNAIALAKALNWHGETKGTDIRNRRSTLLGEKGYGLGVCGTWDFPPNVAGRLKT
ncbi:MAG: type III-B CRISPR module-associated Cmr3 family protein [Limisphaerales bacterium]